MNKRQYAVKLLTVIAESYGSIETTLLLDRVEVPRSMRPTTLKMLHHLESIGVLTRYGVGKFKWKIKNPNWDRENPFRTKPQDPNQNIDLNKPSDDMQVQDRVDQHGNKLSRFHNPRCQRCGNAIPEGTPITKWTNPMTHKDTWVHKDCGHPVDKVIEDDLNRHNNGDKADEKLVKELLERIEKLEQVRKVEITIKKPATPDRTIKEHVHPIFEQVLFHVGCDDSVMLVGPAGCGKTHLAGQVAKVMDREFGFLSLSGGITEGRLFGRPTPNITTGKNEFNAAQFATMFEDGGLFLLDEVDASDPNVLLSLNSALSNRKLSLDRAKKPIAVMHEDFIVMAAANTWGNGADRQYVGRNQQDTAFTARFTQLAMDYDKGLERNLCPGGDELVDRMHKYRNNMNANRIERTLQTRFILRAYNWVQHGKDLEYVDDMLFAGWREDEIRKTKGSN